MAISNYSELKTSIANFLARTDLTDQIPNFILLAEARLSRDLETRGQEKRAQSALTTGDEFLTLPTDMREVRFIKLLTSPSTVLEYKSPHVLDSEFSGNTNGKPQAYSIVGSELKLRPIPDESYNVEIIYIGSLQALSDSNTTNDMLTRHPDAYLMGSLVEAYLYLMDQNSATIYDQKFSRIIEEIRTDEQRSHYGTGSLSMSSIYSNQAN